MNDPSCQSAGIYLHLPFCESLCPYCDFYSLIGNVGLLKGFAALLTAEMDLTAAPFREYSYDSVYFGGGTPSTLELNQIRSILSALSSRFSVSGDAEMTIECNPSSVTDGKLQGYRTVGLNRLSLGIQSFDDSILRTLGRKHDSKTANETFVAARRAGFGNISIDLIYGVPGQTIDLWKRDLDNAIALQPDHISAYNLIIEPGTEFGRLYSRGELSPPEENEQQDMYYLLVDMLPGRGYHRYEISNFARDGKRCHHNMKYWTNIPYLGLGPSAVSFDGEKRIRNIPDYEKYRDAIAVGISPADSVELIDMEKAIEERVMMGLRLANGLSITELLRDCRYDVIKAKGKEIELLQANGYIEIADDRIRITRSGLFLADEIMVRLI